tara:strand:+ start:660 stop:1046 length:387 start_codon:yes stop_codon:yes gene_type:complete
MKYNENIILHKLKEFIAKSYKGHYTTTEEGFQAMDIFRQLGIDKNFCQANAIKYLLRYGKKQGRNIDDLYKACHYIILLISSEDKDKSKKTTAGRLYARGEDWINSPPSSNLTEEEEQKEHPLNESIG